MFPERIRASALVIAGCVTLAGCSQTRALVQRVNPETQRQVETKLVLGRAHESEGNTEAAERLYREVLALDPENAAASHRLGVVLMSDGHTDEGLLHLEQANLLRPDQADVLADLGFAYLDSGDVDQALPLLRSAYERSPRDKRIINNLAQALGYSGEYDQSFALFREIMTEAEATSNLAFIYAQTGNGQKAMELYSRALDLDPKLRPAADALVELGTMRNEYETRRPAAVEWASRQADAPGQVADQPATREIELTGGEAGWRSTSSGGIDNR